MKVGEKNVQHPEMAEWHKILLLHLHIKLGLMKNFVKAMDRKHISISYKYSAMGGGAIPEKRSNR
jgi:hypothetical protein